MEDWEEFFVEKSRRRADKERSERRRQRTNGAIALGTIIILIVGLLIALYALR